MLWRTVREQLLCSSLKHLNKGKPPPTALHTAGGAQVSQGSANPSHPSALPSPGKQKHLAAAAPSDFQATAKQLGKTAPAPSSLLQALRRQPRVSAPGAGAQQGICYSRIAKNDLVWPTSTRPTRQGLSALSWHPWGSPSSKAAKGVWGFPFNWRK